MPTPISVIHAALLHTGKVLFIADAYSPDTVIWDPEDPIEATAFSLLNGTTTGLGTNRLACCGHSFLSDGKLLAAGGDAPTRATAWKFNPATEQWEPAGPMAYARWYPTRDEFWWWAAAPSTADPPFHRWRFTTNLPTRSHRCTGRQDRAIHRPTGRFPSSIPASTSCPTARSFTRASAIGRVRRTGPRPSRSPRSIAVSGRKSRRRPRTRIDREECPC